MNWKAFSLFLFVLLMYLDTTFSKTKRACAKNRDKYEKQRKERTSEDNHEKCECGKLGTEKEQATLIVGNGSLVNPIYKYPWMVAIFVNNRLNCGASIISQNFVLTAAHCIILNNKTAILQGVYEKSVCKLVRDEEFCSVPLYFFHVRFNAEVDGLENAVDIRSVTLHPKYYSSLLQYDIALIKTVTKLPCDKFTAPICLPTLPGLYCVGANATTTGWGQSNLEGFVPPIPSEAVLREAKLVLEANSVCEKIRITMDHLCASGDNQNTCHGDSGGPLFEEVDGVNYLIGITSFAEDIPECDYTQPVFYTKVKVYIPWIMKTIGEKSKSKKKKKGKKCYNNKGVSTNFEGRELKL